MPGPGPAAERTYDSVRGEEKSFEYPMDLAEAQRSLTAVRVPGDLP
ncbi:hypothetical protein [Kitasatospora cinereorecta]|uniref:Uncharacterized protein n=1 Tax=Kitasatospora cinereorecta TaxID=285560 RepID=A0ABW0VIK8_9ACTN